MTLFTAEALRVFFFSREDPLRNVSAGTGLPATAESAGAFARYHAQDGRHAVEAIFCTLVTGVACVLSVVSWRARFGG